MHRGIGGQPLPVPFPIPGSSFEAHIIIGRNSSKTDPFQALTGPVLSLSQVLFIPGTGVFGWTEAEKPGLNDVALRCAASPAQVLFRSPEAGRRGHLYPAHRC